ncbi:variable large protein (plasmid) [Candidatus Borrelia fainii]|uniref:Variable large protein n=1 Tax=Candidatus Borrelia fainii TaxID=2518322 RepID=A0ABM8DLJ9_9SPIR|nr:variable large family protein [Candidatus Borrelia fainii]BDU63467.1 variable large protein [Candidatus Borrelia fainii]
MKRITLSALLMTLFLLLSCGSGSANVEDPKSKFLNVFTSFGNMVTNAFGIKADTTKSEVGKYFAAIETTITSVKKELQEAVDKNENYSKVKSLVEQFITNTLKKIADGANEAAKGATGEDKIGGAKDQEGAPGDSASVNALVKGIREIVSVVLKDNEGSAEATKTAGNEKKSIGKLLGKKDDGTEEHAAAASASIGAVTGADILKAIAKSAEAANNDVGIDQAKNAAEIAAAKKEDDKEFGDEAQKDAVIAAGIALRAMAKGGKFAAKSEDKSANAVNGAVASAVTKALNTLTIAIRNTVDNGLKSINDTLATKGATTPESSTGGQ